jgi:C4-dicarboxylate transporter DctM subunit
VGFDRLEIGIGAIVVTLILMALRVPIGIALGLSAFAGIALITNFDAAIGIVRSVPYSFVATWEFSAIPMFLLMGFVAAGTGVTRGLFIGLRNLCRNIPGGLASASVLATALFSSGSGSSLATAAAMSRITVPEMLKAGYNKGLATGAVAAAGGLGSLIPPSILMVIYGVFTGAPIGQLFMAGVLPGILTAVACVLLITVRVWLKPSLAPKVKIVPGEVIERAKFGDIWPLPILVLGVMGGIFTGAFSATEAGAVGAALAILVAFVRRTLTVRSLLNAIVDTAKSTAGIFVIAMGAAMFQRLMGLSQLPNELADVLLQISDNPIVIISLIAVCYVILGMFLDSMGIMLLTLPLLLPILTGLDINLVWFGIIVIKLLEIGLITPPVGMNCFVVKSSLGAQVDLATIFKGVFWFVIMEFALVIILIAFPQISLYLPALLSGK